MLILVLDSIENTQVKILVFSLTYVNILTDIKYREKREKKRVEKGDHSSLLYTLMSDSHWSKGHLRSHLFWP